MNQKDYSLIRPQMLDFKSRKDKAEKIFVALTNYLGQSKIKKCKILDVGSSTGIIDYHLALEFGEVWGIDIDKNGVNFAKNNFKKNNLHFIDANANKIPFKSNSFDVVICTHVYEHVPDPKQLFNEIYRVLKPGAVCYLAAQNKLFPWEPHHNLFFLSYLPQKYADFYLSLFRKIKKYNEHPLSYWGLKKITKKFKIIDFTSKILSNPHKYKYHTPLFLKYFAQIGKYLTPTFIWILKK